MSQNQNQDNDIGRQISDTVRTALQSGDLSRLKDIGPTVERVVKQTVNTAADSMKMAVDGSKGQKNPENGQQNGGQGTNQPPSAAGTGHPYVQQARAQQQYTRPPVPRPPQRPAWQGSAPLPARKPGPPAYTGIPAGVFGIVGAAVFGVAAFISVLAAFTSSLAFTPAGVFLAGTVVFSGLAGSGFKKNALAGRVRKYYQLLEHRPVTRFDEMAAITGQPEATIKKDIKKALRKNMMPDIRLDFQETSVIRGEDMYRQYLEAQTSRQRLEAQEAAQQKLLDDPETAQLATFKSEGAATVKKIRQANDAIPGEEISSKLDALENTTAQIFSYVEEHPEKLPDTRRFMSYYLPTTLKLVEKYRDYEALEVQPPSVVSAKADIEKSLDKINLAFRNMLDSLYQDDTLDVTTDIEVLEAMLEQEGLINKRFEMSAGSGEKP